MEAEGVLDPLITILHDLNTTDDLIEKVEACLAVYSPLLMCNKLKRWFIFDSDYIHAFC